MQFSHLALLATLKEAAPLHKRREQATVVPAHFASIFADMHNSSSACWLRDQGSEVKKQSRSNQPSLTLNNPSKLGQRTVVGGN